MTIKPLVLLPDPVLREVSKPVERIDDTLLRFADDMLDTMYAANGIGLAATQVDVHERVVVIDVSEERDQPLVLINPEITWLSDERVRGDEGCLSVPGIYDGVERAARVKVTALDRDGQSREIEADGLLAVCIQHELDHLLGKVFVDYLSPLKRTRIKSKLQKQEREAAKETGRTTRVL